MCKQPRENPDKLRYGNPRQVEYLNPSYLNLSFLHCPNLEHIFFTQKSSCTVNCRCCCIQMSNSNVITSVMAINNNIFIFVKFNVQLKVILKY